MSGPPDSGFLTINKPTKRGWASSLRSHATDEPIRAEEQLLAGDGRAGVVSAAFAQREYEVMAKTNVTAVERTVCAPDGCRFQPTADQLLRGDGS